MLGRQIYVRVSRCSQHCLGSYLWKWRLAWETWGDLLQSHTAPLCRGSRQSPLAETQPDLCSWPWPKSGYSHELVFRVCILNKELSESKPFGVAVFSFLKANNDFFFPLSIWAMLFPPKKYAVPACSWWMEQTSRREDIAGGSGELEVGRKRLKETPHTCLSLLIHETSIEF